MAKTKWTFAKHLRSIEIPVTDTDPDGVVLVELPKGGIASIWVSVEDAFNTSAKLELKLNGSVLVAAHAIDATGFTAAVLTSYVHESSAQQLNLTATVSDKSAVGLARVVVNFFVDRDTNFH